MIELPPLPKNDHAFMDPEGDQPDILVWRETSMRAYGEACARAAIEAAAGICDRFAEREMHPAECAGAIRRL